MRSLVHGLAISGLFAVAAAGCGDDEGSGGAGGSTTTTSTTTTSSSPTTTTTTGTTTSSTSSTTSTGMTGMGQVRVAHLSPGTPDVDFCVIPNGGAPIGPVLKGAGDTDGLAYSEVTDYVELPEGTYDVRIVAPNAANCDEALAGLPDVTGVAVAANGVYTAAATGVLIDPGAGDEDFAVQLYEDDLTSDAANVRVRFIHASPDTPNVDVGVGSGQNFTPVWTNVAFPSVGLVGGEAYVAIPPPTDATLSARATGTMTDALVLTGVTLPAGAVVTVFAVGNLDGDPEPLKALACIDGTGTCLLLPP